MALPPNIFSNEVYTQTSEALQKEIHAVLLNLIDDQLLQTNAVEGPFKVRLVVLEKLPLIAYLSTAKDENQEQKQKSEDLFYCIHLCACFNHIFSKSFVVNN